MLITALAALLTVTAFADDPDEPMYTSSDGKFTVDLFSHMGWGYHITSSKDFKPAGAGEFFFNIAKIGLYPAEHLGLELGVDIEGNYFRSKENFFELDSQNKIKAIDIASYMSSLSGGYERARGSFSFLTFNAPVLVKGIFDKFELGVGAEASLNCLGDTYTSYRIGNKQTEIDESGAEINLFSYGLVATIGYDDMSLYFKYYPKGSKVLPDGSVDFSFVTVGIAFGF